MQAVFKSKNIGSAPSPSFGTLGERMSQGGRQQHSHAHGLAQQMEQGSGYTQKFEKKTLGALMGQR